MKFSKTPKHIGIIMDGNGRWAKKYQYQRNIGHEKGAKNLVSLLDTCLKYKIACVSLFSFSTENWRRPVAEVNFLFKLLKQFIEEYLTILKEKKIKIKVSGKLVDLPKDIQNIVQQACLETQNNKRLIANFCINYGSQYEILQACQSLIYEHQNFFKQQRDLQEIEKKITQKELEKYLYTHGLPEVDFLIRTSGEYRLSNFLLYQSAYAELYFTDTLWPDFSEESLVQSLEAFQKRKRKFGRVVHD